MPATTSTYTRMGDLVAGDRIAADENNLHAGSETVIATERVGDYDTIRITVQVTGMGKRSEYTFETGTGSLARNWRTA